MPRNGCSFCSLGGAAEGFKGAFDSGAAGCLFDASLADALQLDLRSGTRSAAIGLGNTRVEIWYHSIELHVEGVQYGAEVAFANDLPTAGILGRKGFFDRFKVTFTPVVPLEFEVEPSDGASKLKFWR